MATLALVLGTTGGCAVFGVGSGRVDTYTLSNTGASDAALGRLPTGWTAEPTSPDPEFLAALGPACEDNFSGEGLPELLGTGATLQDQRGPDGAAFLWTGDTTAYCFIGRTDEGNLQSPFGAWREVVLAGSLKVEGNEPGPPSMVTGAVDPAAAAVEIETASGLLLRASTGDGRFVAWWPGKDPYTAIRSLAADGTVLEQIVP
jgi:hypothetical protein